MYFRRPTADLPPGVDLLHRGDGEEAVDIHQGELQEGHAFGRVFHSKDIQQQGQQIRR